MLEYGQGVGQVSGQAGGSGGSGGGGVIGNGAPNDLGAAFGDMVGDAVHTISTMPPAMLVAGAIIILLGLIFLRRAF